MKVTLDQFDVELIYVKLDQFGLECKTYSCTLKHIRLMTNNFEVCLAVVPCHFALF